MGENLTGTQGGSGPQAKPKEPLDGVNKAVKEAQARNGESRPDKTISRDAGLAEPSIEPEPQKEPIRDPETFNPVQRRGFFLA